eukprot:6178071-Pleurochrysis_carterae.AAC.6
MAGADVLNDLGFTKSIFDTKSMQSEHVRRVRELMAKLELELFGDGFGLSLHYKIHPIIDKILRIMEAASKHFRRESDRRVHLPVAVTSHIKPIEERLGVAPAEDRRLALKSYTVVVQKLLAQDSGIGDIQPLPFLLGGRQTIPLVILFDATGFGPQQ